MQSPSITQQEHLRQLVTAKQASSVPLSQETKNQGFKGWHERGYLPHCDKPGLAQFVTFRLADSLPAAQRGEWEHLLVIAARSNAPRSAGSREQRLKLEAYLDRGLGECSLRDSRVASFTEDVLLYHHGSDYQIIAWVIMPNHVHVLMQVGDVPLMRIIQNWKSMAAVEANRLLHRTGRFWQPEYWDRYMRDAAQQLKAVHYIEHNPVKAGLCLTPEAWPHSSARFRDPATRELRPQ